MMVRKYLSLFVGAVAVASLGAAPAGASTPLPSGSINCTENAVLTLNPPLTPAMSTKPVKVKVSQVTPGSCDTSHVTGGKAPITQFALKIPGLAKGGFCDNYAADPSKPFKIQVKWQGLNSAGHVMTVAVSNAIGDPVYYDSFNGVWTLSLGTQTKGPFVGDNILVTLTWAMSQTDADAACGSPTGLASVPVTVQVQAIAPA